MLIAGLLMSITLFLQVTPRTCSTSSVPFEGKNYVGNKQPLRGDHGNKSISTINSLLENYISLMEKELHNYAYNFLEYFCR